MVMWALGSVRLGSRTARPPLISTMPVREGGEERAMRLASELREAKCQRMDEAEGAAVTDAAFMHDDGGSAVAGASAHDDGGSAVAGATAPVSPLPEDDGDDADNDDDMSAAAAAPSGEHDTAAAATAAACAEDGGSIAVNSEQGSLLSRLPARLFAPTTASTPRAPTAARYRRPTSWTPRPRPRPTKRRRPGKTPRPTRRRATRTTPRPRRTAAHRGRRRGRRQGGEVKHNK